MPEYVEFRTKPQLARLMLERALESVIPFGWVTGDAVYGSDRNLRRSLEREGIPHVLAIKSNKQLWDWTSTRCADGMAGIATSSWRCCPGDVGSRLPGGDQVSSHDTGMPAERGAVPAGTGA